MLQRRGDADDERDTSDLNKLRTGQLRKVSSRESFSTMKYEGVRRFGQVGVMRQALIGAFPSR